ncbi:hypothetical protein [Saccharopolyspora mangrovi]|uniref:Guanylate cyclase domain-containing protein n=1 Tax=Saccharopolyspora mangrovi TaxID=3082379 RepID=A0ABU6AK43_9PSEU|nr:hypothetical protein [Saccharopolyspora sp. S2-29]MEB3371918.1 hypothetical protein [Saccharopolyspora sp. S2-29]
MDHESTDGLGQYTGILAVDVRQFSKHNTSQQQTIVQLLPTILQKSAERADISELLQRHIFRAFRGDGYLIGFNPDLIGTVIDRFLDALQAELRRHSAELRSSGIELRLRASLHLGPLRSFNTLAVDSPSGTLMVESGRMVDADAVRALLDHSDPRVTLLAAVVSEEVMKNVIEAGWTARQPSEFVAAPLRVNAKDYSGTGYLRVPTVSGELLRSGLLHGQPEQPATESTEPSSKSADHISNTLDGRAQNATQAQNVHDGVHYNSVHADAAGIAVHGDGNTTAGGNVDQSTNKQEYSGHFHTQGDSNFGPSSGRRTGPHNDPSGR